MTTVIPQIDALPVAPSRLDMVNFAPRGDAMMTALPVMVTQINIVTPLMMTLAAAVDAAATAAATSAAAALTSQNAASASATAASASATSAATSAALVITGAPALTGASTTSLTIGAPVMTFTMQTGKAFVPGQYVRIFYDATRYMEGLLTAYNSATGATTVVASVAAGSGTFAVWSIILTSSVQVLQGETLSADGQAMTSSAAYVSEYVTAPAGSLLLLPDARLFKVGFVREINAVNAVSLMQADGVYVGSGNVPAGLSRLWLLDNTTLGGVWSVTPAVALTTLTQATLPSLTTTITSSLTAANTHTKTIALDATRSLIAYSTAGASAVTSGLYVVMATCGYTPLGRPTFNLSAPVLVSGGANVGVGTTVSNGPGCILSACLIGTDLVAVSWHEYNAGSTTPRCVVISTSGANPAPGTVLSLHAAYAGALSGTGGTQGTAICSPAANTFVVSYQDPTATQTIFARVCVATGISIAAGPEYTVQAIGGTAGAINSSTFAVAHSASLVSFATYNAGGDVKTYITAGVITGNTINMGLPVVFAAVTGTPTDLASLGSTAGICTGINGTSSFAYTISGTVPSIGNQFVTANGNSSIGVASATKAFLFGSSATAAHLAISGNTISAESPATITGMAALSTANNPAGNALLSGTAMISGSNVINVAAATLRGTNGTNGAAMQVSLTGSGKYSMQVTSNGSTTVSVRAYLPIISLA